MGLFDRLFGSASDREMKKLDPIVDQILNLEGEMAALSDDELKGKTADFKQRIGNGATLDDLLPEAFAVVREAAFRVLGMKHYPVQLKGGIILHQGKIAEMKTGEGKTLVATLPAYLNALSGKGVHVVTVNDYLAQRDMEWMGKVHQFLGLTVGCIIYGLENDERQENYNCDITYGTNNQFGFDYLRDNMVIYKKDVVQRDLHYAIIDEVDSILIDEARTPLIISGEGDDSSDRYRQADNFVRTLTGRILDPDEDKSDDPFNREMKVETVDFVVDEKRKTANLTEVGTGRAEKFFGLENLSDPDNMEIAHHINIALRAHNTMKRDIDYVVKDDEILIVDEFTGRIMQGRRYSDGLHQAIEAKENVEVKSESKTLATITFQNYFRMYKKLAGMTGTALTEEEEFAEIYHMDVVEIPTHHPVVRKDEQDRVYISEMAKFRAIIEEIKEIHATGQPILVGTVSIEISELLSKMLKKERVPHEVLNAKQHEREAEIVAQAGRFGKVTIATNMAGRGTDIVLGGNPEYRAKMELEKRGMPEEVLEQVDTFTVYDDPEIIEARKQYQALRDQYKIETEADADKVKAVGGLYIIGTERHESRRIDNQLRGRSGRQGDPGTSRFYASLSDNLMRLFGGETIQNLATSGNFPEDEPIEAKALTSAIERAQKKVEANNFDIRKRVLQYDDVMNVQREVIYKERRNVLDGEDMKNYILSMVHSIVDEAIGSFTNPQVPASEWEIEGLMNYLNSIYMPKGALDLSQVETMDQAKLRDFLIEVSEKIYNEREAEFGAETFREVERVILLRVVDSKWMDHIDAMDQLKQGIGLRAFGNEDPVRAYGNEGYTMFEEMNHTIKEETVKFMYNIRPAQTVQRQQVLKPSDEKPEVQQPVKKGKKIGRNDPCPCGSGLKYKKCHGKNA